MRPILTLSLILCTALAACGGEPDEVPANDEAALAPELATGLSMDEPSGAAPEMPPHDGSYEGDIALVSDRVEGPASLGDVRLCNMTLQASGSWEEVCYVVEMGQHRDGSLHGEGTRVSVRRTDDETWVLAPADRDSVEVFGHIAADDLIHLQFEEGGRTWYARYDTPTTVDFGDGVATVTGYKGEFWSDGPAAARSAVIDYETEYGE